MNPETPDTGEDAPSTEQILATIHNAISSDAPSAPESEYEAMQAALPDTPDTKELPDAAASDDASAISAGRQGPGSEDMADMVEKGDPGHSLHDEGDSQQAEEILNLTENFLSDRQSAESAAPPDSQALAPPHEPGIEDDPFLHDLGLKDEDSAGAMPGRQADAAQTVPCNNMEDTGQGSTPPDPHALVSDATAMAIRHAFGELQDNRSSGHDIALGDFVGQIIRPYLHSWLDAHLQPIVEKLVAAEIRRLSGNQTPGA